MSGSSEKLPRLTRLLSQHTACALNINSLALDQTTSFNSRSAGATPGLEELYLTTMDAVEALTPGDALFMIQGSVASNAEDADGRRPRSGFNLTTGDGFVTSTALIKAGNLSDPRPFFNELLLRPYVSRTILAPHLYPPSLSTRLEGGVPGGGAELYEKLAASWGKLAKTGYCVSTYCKRFPIVIGELAAISFHAVRCCISPVALLLMYAKLAEH